MNTFTVAQLALLSELVEEASERAKLAFDSAVSQPERDRCFRIANDLIGIKSAIRIQSEYPKCLVPECEERFPECFDERTGNRFYHICQSHYNHD